MTHLRLYSYWRSSSAWRVRIGLALKGLPFELRPVDLAAGEQFGEAHRARNPLQQVPVLEVEDGGPPIRLTQSMAILEYLEERWPAPPLLPADPAGRARVRALAEIVNSGIQPLHNAAVVRRIKERWPGHETEWLHHWIVSGLGGLEAAVNQGPVGRFCHGDRPGLAECYLVPQLYAARRFGVELTAFPTLGRIEEACATLPEFQQAHATRQPDVPETVP